MPHINIKMYPGRSEDMKQELTNAIVKDVLSIVQCDEKWISVVFEEIDSSDWPEKVYKPEIMNKQDKLYKKPGYNPLE
jgi:4-oxalocrotonate tautomerase